MGQVKVSSVLRCTNDIQNKVDKLTGAAPYANETLHTPLSHTF